MRNRLDLALVALLVATFVQIVTAQEASRYAASAALAEQHTFVIDDYRDLLSADRAVVGDHVYSDKAPGQPVMGAVVHELVRAVGGEPGTVVRHRENLNVWAQSLVFCTLPAALLLVLMRRNAGRSEPRPMATAAAFGLAFGTVLLPMSSSLYAHVLVALLTFAAWHVLSAPHIGPEIPVGRLLGAGSLCALASLSEYPMFAAAFLLAGFVGHRFGLLRAAWFGLPVLGAIGAVLAHNRIVYDSWSTAYSDKPGADGTTFIGLFDPSFALRILFGEKGFAFTPIVLVALIGFVIAARRRRTDVVVPALMFAGYFWLQASWVNPWGGEPPGPRYIAPALPFLVVPASLAMARLGPRVQRLVIGLGCLSMGLALVTLPLLPDGNALISGHLRNLDRFGLTPTVFTMALGPLGWLVHLALVAAAGFHLWRCWPRPDTATEAGGEEVSSPRPRPAASP